MPYPRDTHYNLSAEQRAELASRREPDNHTKLIRRKTTIIGPIGGDSENDAEDKTKRALGRRLTGKAPEEAEKSATPPLSELAACIAGDVGSGYLAGASVAPILCIIDKVGAPGRHATDDDARREPPSASLSSHPRSRTSHPTPNAHRRPSNAQRRRRSSRARAAPGTSGRRSARA